MKSKSSNYDQQVDIGKRIFLEYDQDVLIRKYRLTADEDCIYITYLNTPCRIDRKNGSVEEYTDGSWMECRSYNTVMTIYDLLCYHKGLTAPPLFRSWCTVGTFTVAGASNTEVFTKKYACLFDTDPNAFVKACISQGGILQEPAAGADLTFLFYAAPFFPVLLRFWESDEEFPPKLIVMWDRNTPSFLHYETTFFLQGDLLERLKKNFIALSSD